MRTDKKPPQKAEKKTPSRTPKRGVVGYSKKSALLEEAITHMNTGKYGRSSAVLKELLGLDPQNMEARRLFATLHLRIGSLVTARQAFESLANEAIGRQDFWLAESLLREYLAAGPRCVPFLELLAHVYAEKGDVMGAVAELGKAIDILIEDPDSENPKKPSQLYAKVRELAPASTVAMQFASLFDIQTGEFLGSHPVVPAAATSLEADASQSQDLMRATTEEASPSDVVPWEQFDSAPANPEVPLPASPNPVIESIEVPEVLRDPEPVGLDTPELLALPSESAEPILMADSFGQDVLTEMSSLPDSEETPAAMPLLAEPSLSSSEQHNDGLGEPIVELSSVADEEPTIGFPEERAAGVEIAISSPAESPGLSAPMPWEQVEHSNIRIEDAAPPMVSPAQSDEAPLFGAESFPASPSPAPPESISDQLASLTSSPELPEPGESSGVDSAASLEVLPVPEVASPSAGTQPETVPDQLTSLASALEGPELDKSAAVDAPVRFAVFPAPEVSGPSVTPPSEFVVDLLASPVSAPELPDSRALPVTDTPAGLEVFPEPDVASSSANPQPEVVSDQSVSLVSVPETTDLSVSTVADVPASSVASQEPETPAPSVMESSPTVPFSWSTVFDGAWKFGAGTLFPSSPTALSMPDAVPRDARESESVQREPVSEPAQSVPLSTSVPEAPAAFSDPEPVPSAHSAIMSEAVAGPAATREPELPAPSAVFASEEPSWPEEPPILSKDIISSFEVNVSAPLEPIHESEPVSPLSFLAPQFEVPLPEASVPEPVHTSVIPEAPPAPEPISTEHHEIAITLFQPAAAPLHSSAPSDPPAVSLSSMDVPSHWSTGEVEVQSHRPAEKKRNWDKDKGEATVAPPTPVPLADENPEPVAEPLRGWESAPSEVAPPVVEAVAPVVELVVPQEDMKPDWVRASESITFVNPSPSSPATWQDSGVESVHAEPEPVLSVAASAVDVLFDSTGPRASVRTQDRMASPKPVPRLSVRVARVRIGISSFIWSCFSTTRSMALLCVGLALSCMAVVAFGVGAVGLAWMVMEVPPSPAYHNLTASPPRPLSDSRKNGYFLLLGFDTSAERDPLQAGYERKVEGNELQAANVCMAGDEGKGMTTAGASANVVRGWFSSADPVAQMNPQAAAVRSWAAQESVALRRYQQWLSMPFEDVGYGQILSPNCAQVLLAHRLYLAEGFAQDLNTGLGRLESDMGSWRTALGQSKTLMVKMLAATAVQDNVAIASGLLTRSDLDGTAIGRIGKIVRPLDQVELSLRWPMQSHFAWATKSVTASLKTDKANERPLYVAMAAGMPLPVQRRANAYADYYEAASKAVAEGRYTNLPKLSGFIRTPAVSVVDYVANPIEHIIGVEPLPSWDSYVGRIVETDVRLRLAGLQVWIRRGPQEGNVLTRLAKAGQAYYDPFTGLPMLLNQQRGVMYSVGQDGKDQDGDLHLDVVATIPTIQSVVTESSRSVLPPRPK